VLIMSIPGPFRQQQGVTLIEVLVTLVVISIGLLGVAAMQGLALSNAHGAHHHTLATTIAYDALDRARAELDGRVIVGSVPESVRSGIQQIYADSRYNDRFPGGVNVVLQSAGSDLVVTVSWNDDRLGENTGAGEVDTRSNQVTVRSRLL
jgi:type IV pilus assembly protein PilV